MIKRLFQLGLAVRRRQITEVCECLDPKVATRAGVIVIRLRILYAHSHNLLIVLLLNIIVQKLLLQVETLTAFFHAFWEMINLKQEQDVVNINLIARVISLDEIKYLLLEIGLLSGCSDSRGPYLATV